ncbi:hypothetical protein MOBT1_003232 [Malassezia obtusa]|uniref:Uncharacterized protein n=1 Tax=Malassezia obtusa TaxID=76774 RepID=A0AAF0IXV6_9BASI|nr:hypothetical protein MOBT1_003232 [Malassezia obtusa]
MHVLPYLAVEPDAAEVLDEVRTGAAPDASVWVSAYRAAPERTSVHGGVRICDAGASLHATHDALTVAAHTPRAVSVACAPLGIPPTRVCLATRRGTLPGAAGAPHGAWSLAFARSASGLERWCVGGPDAVLHVGEWCPDAPEPFAMPIPLGGHRAEISSVRFFPSGEVLLTTSLDYTAKIYSAIDGSNPRTLTGHTRAVYSSAIVGRGREVLTGSLDATVRMWDVSRGATTTTLAAPGGAGVLTLETHDACAYAGLASGTLAVWDIRASDTAATHDAPRSPLGEAGGVTALAVDGARLAVGTRAGVCAVYDVRHPAAPLDTFWRNTAEITQVRWHDGGLLVATSDGLPFRSALPPRVLDEWVGWEADRVDALAADARGAVVAAGGGAYALYAP